MTYNPPPLPGNISADYFQALAIATTADVNVDQDRSVFFSGTRNRRKAVSFCRMQDTQNENFKTILDTQAWRKLVQHDFITRDSLFLSEDKFALRDIVCRRFSEQASGNVTAFINPQRPFGTFFRIELPILLANDKVQTINDEPKEAYRPLVPSQETDTIDYNNDL